MQRDSEQGPRAAQQRMGAGRASSPCAPACARAASQRSLLPPPAPARRLPGRVTALYQPPALPPPAPAQARLSPTAAAARSARHWLSSTCAHHQGQSSHPGCSAPTSIRMKEHTATCSAHPGSTSDPTGTFSDPTGTITRVCGARAARAAARAARAGAAPWPCALACRPAGRPAQPPAARAPGGARAAPRGRAAARSPAAARQSAPCRCGGRSGPARRGARAPVSAAGPAGRLPQRLLARLARAAAAAAIDDDVSHV